MSANQSPSRLTSFPSAVWAEFVQLGVIRHPISLAVMLALACLVLRIPNLSLDLMGAGVVAPPLYESYPLVLCACAAWASIVWSQLRPDQRWFVYALPVRQATFLLARVAAGALWMFLLVGIAIGGAIVAGDNAHFTSTRELIIAYAAGCTLAFVLVSALAIVVRFPLYVTFALIAVPLAIGRVLRMQSIAGADYADGIILGERGLFGTLAGLTAVQADSVFTVTPTASWTNAIGLWLVAAFVALLVAAKVATRR